MEFKDVLKDLRIKNNLSQQQLADKIYVSRSAVAKWENGLGLPNEDSVEQLMKFFDCDRNYLFPVIKHEEVIMKNQKIHKFKFGYLIASLSVILIAAILTIVFIRINNSNNPVQELTIVPVTQSYNYSYDDKKEEDGIYYIINDDQAIICGYNETLGNDIVIKENYEGYVTTKIGYDAFKFCVKLKTVVLPNTIRTISCDAFNGCTNLTSVTISKDKVNRRRVQPSKLYWFSIAEVDNAICNNAFCNCTNLVNIELPDNIEYIMNYAFEGCSNIRSIYIPKNIKDINPTLFSNCTNLESIIVDNENPIYDSRENCNGIVLTLSNELIVGCKSTIIPDSVTTIGVQAFYSCEGLTTINIPDSVTTIKNQAFEYCTSLTSITIPKSVISINGSAFSGCDNLVSISVDKDNPIYDSRDNCNAIIVTNTNSLRAGCKTTIIPNSVVSIEGSAFINNRKITNITIPSSVTHIGRYAFSGCISLTTITIPASVIDLQDNAFCHCYEVTEIIFESGTKTINGNAFYGCTKVQEIIIPETVEEINSDSFFQSDFLTIKYYGKKSKWRSITKKGWDEKLDNYVVVCENGKIYK